MASLVLEDSLDMWLGELNGFVCFLWDFLPPKVGERRVSCNYL